MKYDVVVRDGEGGCGGGVGGRRRLLDRVSKAVYHAVRLFACLLAYLLILNKIIIVIFVLCVMLLLQNGLELAAETFEEMGWQQQ